MVRTLVTGATETLGGELLPRLRDADHEVSAASRSPPADDTATEWAHVDLTDRTGLKEALTSSDIVIHAAAALMGDSEPERRKSCTNLSQKASS